MVHRRESSRKTPGFAMGNGRALDLPFAHPVGRKDGAGRTGDLPQRLFHDHGSDALGETGNSHSDPRTNGTRVSRPEVKRPRLVSGLFSVKISPRRGPFS